MSRDTATIPAKPAMVLNRLSEYVVWVRYDWATYLALYTNAPAVETLESTAHAFFSSLKYRLRDSVLLSLARLFDAPNPVQDNLTLSTTVALLEKFSDASFAAHIADKVKEASVRAEPVRQERHKRIAHLDTGFALTKRLHDDVTHEQVESLLAEVEAIMDLIEQEVFGKTTVRSAYSYMARLHVAGVVEKLAVVAAMDKDELADRLSRLPDRSTTYGIPESWSR